MLLAAGLWIAVTIDPGGWPVCLNTLNANAIPLHCVFYSHSIPTFHFLRISQFCLIMDLSAYMIKQGRSASMFVTSPYWKDKTDHEVA